MFEFSSGELLVIAVVALVVLGPERLPKAARFVGMWVRKARNQWNSVRDELERELAAEELKRELKAAQDNLRKAEEEIRQHTHEAGHDFGQVRDEVRDAVEDRPAPPPPHPDEPVKVNPDVASPQAPPKQRDSDVPTG
ncbi:Sec-independent protein translocase protein TatB [Pseudoxanthomonas composti]|uniref:Sec-independent protein translocase protein TatB n=1 Tax=Pseudoxanthomonas composti TaxID=2137479 RepID=A0A4Q1JW40_9GAMM|nr:Sec-independent protein translocase protein TatB [Pseudoxanthomonas composti]RXR06385.1 twin-arginine translocase subunit TatB [Pseudoxanthomonas composti]